jgi:hypothetical protein
MAEREHPGHCGFVGNGQSFRILAVRFLQQVIRTSDYQTVLTIRLATVVIWSPRTKLTSGRAMVPRRVAKPMLATRCDDRQNHFPHGYQGHFGNAGLKTNQDLLVF